jgi:hypothetical protein
MAKAELQKTKLQKKAMIEAMTKSLGIVTHAIKFAKISRATHYRWMAEDEEYRNSIKEINEIALDLAEHKLHQAINNGNIGAIIFYLKTKGADRGYEYGKGEEISSDEVDEEPVKVFLPDNFRQRTSQKTFDMEQNTG